MRFNWALFLLVEPLFLTEPHLDKRAGKEKRHELELYRIQEGLKVVPSSSRGTETTTE